MAVSYTHLIGKVSKNQLRQITKGMQIQLGMSTKHNNPIA